MTSVAKCMIRTDAINFRLGIDVYTVLLGGVIQYMFRNFENRHIQYCRCRTGEFLGVQLQKLLGFVF